MRKVINSGLALTLMALVPFLVGWCLPTSKPHLAVGMTVEEVDNVLDSYSKKNRGVTIWGLTRIDDFSYCSVDALGNQSYISVTFRDGTLDQWEAIPCPRTRPPWLDSAVKAIGW